MIPHRGTALISVIVFVALLLVIFSTSPVPDPSAATTQEGEKESGPASFVPLPKLPSLKDLHLPSFHPTVHEPPAPQPDSSHGESKWFSDLSWLNPFSSSITLDENRSVLPPLKHRPFVYTYYDPSQENGKKGLTADAEFLLSWRRAWFAQGFRPVILGFEEAKRNPLYEMMLPLKLNGDLRFQLHRWLAWGHMGDGLLADWRCFPMARYDDPLLSSLRSGANPEVITYFKHIGDGLYAGVKDRINDVARQAMEKLDEKDTAITDVVSAEAFKLDETSSLALYNSATVTSYYSGIAEKIVRSPTQGRLALIELINSHLHNTFQNAFPAGIAVLKPFAEHTTALVEPALRLAKALGQCPSSPMPESCPPNLQKCHPCDPQKGMHISQPKTYRNTTHVFTIGTLPHPYTLISLQQNSADVTIRHIRRETDRDTWLKEVTQDQLGLDLGGSARASLFKKAVADDPVAGASLWMTVESLPPEAGQSLPSELLDEFEWQFGFRIPRNNKADAKNEGEEKESMQNANPSREGVGREYDILKDARNVLSSNEPPRSSIRDVAEAWNLADTEVWRFVKAYRARSVVERQKWQEEEKNSVGVRL